MPQLDDAKFKELVLAANLVTLDKLAAAEELSKSTGNSLYNSLLQKSLVEDAQIGTMLANFYKIPPVILATTEISDDVLFSIR